MKKFITMTVAAMLAFGATACGTEKVAETAQNAVQSAVDTVAKALSGDVTGEVGTLYTTQWFEFQVNSLETVQEYKGQAPAEGNVFVVANVFEKNVWDGKEALPMGTFDFYMDDDSFAEYVWGSDPWDDAMMPVEFNLEPDQEVTYDLVFEIPADLEAVKLMYTEYDENSNVGATFTINHTL